MKILSIHKLLDLYQERKHNRVSQLKYGMEDNEAILSPMFGLFIDTDTFYSSWVLNFFWSVFTAEGTNGIWVCTVESVTDWNLKNSNSL